MSAAPPPSWVSRLFAAWLPKRFHSLAENALWLYLVQFSGYLLPFLTLPYLSRVLSVEHFGQLAYAQTVIWNFTALTEYGFNLTATRDISVQRDQPLQLSRTFSAVLVSKLLLTFAGFALLLLLVTFVPTFAANRTLLLISFSSVLGYALFPTWLFQGLELMRHVALRDLGSKLLTFVLMFSLVRSDADYVWAAVAQSSGLVLAGVVGIARVSTLTSARFAWPTVAEVWQALRTGWSPFLFNGIAALSYSVSIMIVEWRGLTAEIAYFNAAQRIVAVIRALPGPISVTLFSRLSYQAADSEGRAVHFVEKYWKLFTLPFFLITLALTLLAPWVAPLVLGPKFIPSVVPLQVLAWGPLFLAWSQFYSTYYMLPCGYDKTWVKMATSCVIAGTLCIFPALLFTRGATAIAISLITGELLALICYAAFYYRHSRPFRLSATAATP